MVKNSTCTPASIDALTKGKLHDRRTAGLTIELLPSRKKVWKCERRMPGNGALVRLSFDLFRASTMADARSRAAALNDQLEAGIDPRAREAKEQASRLVPGTSTAWRLRARSTMGDRSIWSFRRASRSAKRTGEVEASKSDQKTLVHVASSRAFIERHRVTARSTPSKGG
jgi:hypothetical protein